MHEKFQQIQSARQFARLMGILEAHHEAILKDPAPYLDRAGAEIHRLRKIIDEAQEALRGRISYMGEPVQFQSMTSVLMERNRAALLALSQVDSAPRTTPES